MAALLITEDELRSATLAIYGVDALHAPSYVWVDHFNDGHSYLRATFNGEFCHRCGMRLHRLARILKAMSDNNASVTIVIYPDGDGDTLSTERQQFVRNRLSGFKG